MFKLRFLIYAVSIIFSGITLFLVLVLRPSWFGLVISDETINYRQFFSNETAVLIAVLILLLSFMAYATFLHWMLWRPSVAGRHKRIVSELKEPFKDMPPEPKETKLEKNLTYQQDWISRKIQTTSVGINDPTPKISLDKQGT